MEKREEMTDLSNPKTRVDAKHDGPCVDEALGLELTDRNQSHLRLVPTLSQLTRETNGMLLQPRAMAMHVGDTKNSDRANERRCIDKTHASRAHW
jgi:hypothetical protein